MEFFKKRIIPKKDVFLVFIACAFIIHLWSVFNLLEVIPGWIVRMSAWEVLSGVSYTQSFALLESISILIILVISGVLLPKKFLREKFVALSSLLLLATSMWAIFIHFFFDKLRPYIKPYFIPLILLMTLTFVLPYFLVYRFQKVEGFVNRTLDRISILVYLIFLVDFICIFIILSRNILVNSI